MAMAESCSSGAPLSDNPIVVVGPLYCSPHPVEMVMSRKVLTLTEGNFVATGTNGNTLFKVKSIALTSIQKGCVLIDAVGNLVVTLKQKAKTMHYTWEVFRGESTKPEDMLFSAKTSSVFYLKTKLDVFLANNAKEEVCDFKVKGGWRDGSCVIYAGDSSHVIAEMHNKHSQSMLSRKQNFMVTVHPNIDYAFIVALIVILDEINYTGMK